MAERSGTKTRPEPGPPPSARQAASARARRRARWRAGLTALVVAALCAGAVWVVAFSPVIEVRRVQVGGVHRLTAAEVAQVAAVPTGGSLALLDTGSIAARVRKLPAVARVSVARKLPHTVRVTVVERTPAVVVATPSGYRLADAEGVAFATVAAPPDDLPLVRTDDAQPSAEVLDRAAQLLAALPPKVRRVLVEIHADTADNMSAILRGGRKVIWGDATQPALKARVLEVLFRRKADVYDVSVPETPVTRR